MTDWMRPFLTETTELYRRVKGQGQGQGDRIVMCEDDLDGPSYHVTELYEHEQNSRPLDDVALDLARDLSWPL